MTGRINITSEFFNCSIIFLSSSCTILLTGLKILTSAKSLTLLTWITCKTQIKSSETGSTILVLYWVWAQKHTAVKQMPLPYNTHIHINISGFSEVQHRIQWVWRRSPHCPPPSWFNPLFHILHQALLNSVCSHSCESKKTSSDFFSFIAGSNTKDLYGIKKIVFLLPKVNRNYINGTKTVYSAASLSIFYNFLTVFCSC